MATIAEGIRVKERRPDQLSGTPRAHAVDRWIFVAMAAWFIAITLTGFIPDAIGKVEAVRAGQRPPFPLVLHLHAVVMGTFLLLLLTQTVLMATGRCALHKRVGIAAFVLVPALVVVGAAVAPAIYHQVWEFGRTGPVELRAGMQERLLALENILLLQIRIGILFPLFMAIGLKARIGHSGLHKRMMFLAPAPALAAAIDRMTWLPTTLPASPLGSDLWVLFAVSPLFVWDVVRNKRVHEAYWIWLAICLPFTIAVYELWDTPGWHATARHIMGV